METLARITGTASRELLTARYRRNRERSARLFALVDPQAFYSRPIPLRHPFAFYEGHLPAFSFLTLNQRALGEAPIDTALERLFQRGIDPSDEAAAQQQSRSQWPDRDAIESFGRACDDRVYAALEKPDLPAEAVYTILEHEPMHHETLMYIVHRLPAHLKGRVPQEHRDSTPPPNEFVEIGAGIATLGAARDRVAFGWDNEFDEHEVLVNAFSVERYPVTNADYRAFVAAGGPAPPFWSERDGEYFLRATFEDLPLPLAWPVYATHEQAEQYAAWKGCRLMSEPEYHRAAFSTPAGNEQPFPWGAQEPDPLLGNFDFERFDPEPVDMHEAGASAWGVYDLIGNGWEWTSSVFEPFPGFTPMASYPQYSADFFDGKHFVMKGASPVTAHDLIRRSFRNWFYGDYAYMYAKFRCVAR